MKAKQENNVPLKMQYLIIAWFLVAFALLPILVLFQTIQDIHLLRPSYEDYTYKTYTFVSLRELDDSDGGGSQYIITVKEEEKKLHINNLMDSHRLHQNLNTLHDGTTFYCYVAEDGARLEVVEIGLHADARFDPFYTLDEYKQEMTVSVCFTIIMCSVFLILSGIFAVRYFRKAHTCSIETNTENKL